MATKLKRIKKILDSPWKVAYADLVAVLVDFGYLGERPKGGSSHETFRKEGQSPITVPYRRPYVGEHYVRSVIEILGLEKYYEEQSDPE